MSEVRLIPNLEDNNHCFQACFAMVYESLTDSPILMEQVDTLTGFVAERPTWPFKGMLSWAEKGLYVKYIEKFSHESFVADPVKTIKDHVQNDEIAQSVIEVSDLEKEVSLVKACLKHPNITFEIRQPSLEDIRYYIKSGCLIVVNVNYYALIGVDKYVGHFVVVEDVNEDTLTLQNPGPPSIAHQVVSKDNFLKAWCYPNERLANMIAVSRAKI